MSLQFEPSSGGATEVRRASGGDVDRGAMRKKRVLIILIALAAVIAIVYAVPRSAFLSSVVEFTFPGVIPASSYAHNLDSSNPDLVMGSLYHLQTRKSPIGVPKALVLLTSSDDYIWLNAATYTGECGRQEAVPYLIKALRHTAYRTDEETARILHALTGEDFGADFGRWQKWWLKDHPDATFDWVSHLGYSPRISDAERKTAVK